MLHLTNLKNSQAKNYYSRADYYTDGPETVGVWLGDGTGKLGLVGRVDHPSFADLIDNKNPITGERLTLRNKSNRRVAFDLTISPPKNISVMIALGNDPRLEPAVNEVVRKSFNILEKYAAVRVRANDQNSEKITGNLICAEFTHTTARPVNGIPDPQWHKHLVLINATWCEDTQQWKALENRFLKENIGYFQAVHNSLMAQALMSLGYEVEVKNGNVGIRGVPQDLVEEFSQRDHVVREARRRRGDISDKEAAKLAAQTREPKAKELTTAELLANWEERANPERLRVLRELRDKAMARQHSMALGIDPATRPSDLEERALKFAVRHCLSRKSTATELDIFKAALEHGVVDSLDLAKLKQLLDTHPDLLRGKVNGQVLITSQEVLDEEEKIVEIAKLNRGYLRPVVPGPVVNPNLSREQREAAELLLNSRDLVTVFAGRAGTGKTTVLKHVVDRIERHGGEVVMLAPTSVASRGVLRDAGFAKADTVSMLLTNPAMQLEAKGKTWILDEAGLMSSPMMIDVMNLAEQLDARIFLSGDIGQHAAVERGDPLRLLQERGVVDVATISTVRRQSGLYKEAVEHLSKGETTEAFEILDEMKSIVEIHDDSRHAKLAQEYLDTLAKGHTSLIVAPTHSEIASVTEAIRTNLKQQGVLKNEREVVSLRRVDMTDPQKELVHNYVEGWWLQMMKPVPGMQTGERCEVVRRQATGLVVRNAAGKERLLDVAKHAKRFQVYRQEELDLCTGDRIRITQNSKFYGHELRNGGLHTVKNVSKDGAIKLENGITLPAGFGHIDHGYAVTSHVGQGRTIDYMFVAESAESLVGGSREQFYTSMSRGKYGVKIYTNDREALLDAVSQSRQRMSALDLVHPQTPLKFEEERPSWDRTAPSPTRPADHLGQWSEPPQVLQKNIPSRSKSRRKDLEIFE